MIRKICLALAATLFSTLASAVTVSTDYTDMWWNPAESGWGANVTQQGDIIFVTLFVYDTNNKPTWFIGPSTQYDGVVSGKDHFTGGFYSVTGPYFGAPVFDPKAVGVTQVGNVSLDFSNSTTGTLTYNVGGVNITKQVQRQTWRTDSVAGQYRGATIGTFTTCNGATSPSTIDNPVTLTITQVASSITISEIGTQNGTAYSCRYTGILTQNGKMGTIVGTELCDTNPTQDFTASNVQVDQNGISMTLTTDFSTCHFAGRMGGMRQQ
ncbi:MAG TPA: hypothetical protein VKR38_07610 [Usitatibacter sp.]|nr:hypothetical protein [Usitatibacter sp.]